MSVALLSYLEDTVLQHFRFPGPVILITFLLLFPDFSQLRCRGCINYMHQLDLDTPWSFVSCILIAVAIVL